MTEFKGLMAVPMDTLAGLVGALLAALMGQKKTRTERFIGFAVGFGFAYFFTSPMLDFFSLKPDTYGGGVGFILGFFGMTIADAVMGTDWKAIIKGRFGGGS